MASGNLLQVRDNNDSDDAKKGISVAVAAVFIVGTMCGSGILALAKAMVQTGWFGIVVLIGCGFIAAYNGSLLGKCWMIIRQRYPEYNRRYITDPYPAIGFRAAGKWGECAARICTLFTLFGGVVVYLLLIVGNLDNLLRNLGDIYFHTCFLIPIVAGCLLPFSWLGTPKDFWQAGVLAAVTTTLGAVFIVAGLGVTATKTPAASHSNPSFAGFFTAFGTILFGFGGASIFPTIQVDMKDPKKFPLAATLGMLCVLLIYFAVSFSGFIVLGDGMTHTNILENMDSNWISYTVNILITSHLLLGFIIVINPVSQDLEGFCQVDDKFSFKRVLVRTILMALVTLVAMSVPHFGVILSLVGATTIAANSFIFPPLFYLLLSRQKQRSDGYEEVFPILSKVSYEEEATLYTERELPKEQEWVNFEVPVYVKLMLIEIMLIGTVGGIASVYSAIQSLIDGTSGFTAPCFADWAAADV